MHVTCGQCSTRYEFEAGDIPAVGYDAECDHCGHLFFVGGDGAPARPGSPAVPHGLPSSPRDGGALVAIACPTCGAVFQFAQGDVPAAGYDAQCTQCEGVFWVSPATVEHLSVAAERPMPADIAQQAATPLADDMGDWNLTSSPIAMDFETTAVSEPNAPREMTTEDLFGSLAQEAAASAAAESFGSQAAGGTLEELASSATPIWPAPMDEEASVNGWQPKVAGVDVTTPGDPLPVFDAPDLSRLPTGVLPADDDTGENHRLRTAPVATARRSKSRRDEPATPKRNVGLWLAALLVLLAGGGSVALWELKPEVFEGVRALWQPPHSVAPEASALVQKGQKDFYADTEAGYQAATAAFSQALQIDNQFIEAQAFALVTHLWHGVDMQSEGSRLHALYEQEAQQVRALQVKREQEKTLTAEEEAESQTLQNGLAPRLAQATDWLERGGKEIGQAQLEAQTARLRFGRDPAIAAAASLCYTQGPKDMAVARALLSQSKALCNDAPAETPCPVMWQKLAQGQIDAKHPTSRAAARKAFAEALAAEPRLLRAKWEMGSLARDDGRTDEARQLFSEVLQQSPEHVKAKVALAALAPPPVAPAAPEPTVEPTEGAEGDSGDAAAPEPSSGRSRRRRRSR